MTNDSSKNPETRMACLPKTNAQSEISSMASNSAQFSVRIVVLLVVMSELESGLSLRSNFASIGSFSSASWKKTCDNPPP